MATEIEEVIKETTGFTWLIQVHIELYFTIYRVNYLLGIYALVVSLVFCL